MNRRHTSNASRTNWNRLRKLRDSEIDHSDIPALGAAFFRRAKIRFPGTKKAVSIRLDADVLDWFRRQGRRYQSRINAVLRAYVEAHDA